MTLRYDVRLGVPESSTARMTCAIPGAFGTIWATSDGGATWLPQTSGTVNDLSGVNFINASTGWSVGAGSTVLKTTTGGHGTTVSATSALR